MRPAVKFEMPPTVKADLIGGHFRRMRKDPTGFLTRLAELGDIASFRMGPMRAYFVNDPDMIRDVLVVNNHKFVKGRALQRARSLIGNGLLTSEGDDHLRQRRMIQPAFHRARIAEYAEAMVEYAENISDKWQDDETRDIDQEMMHLTLRIVARTLFSSNVDDEADKIGAAMTTVLSLFDYLLLPFSEWLEKLPLPHSRRFHKAKNELDSVIYGIIDERRRSGEDKGDLLSMLLLAQDEESGLGMTDEQVRDECLTLFLAGHETTANALTWTWHLLSQNPDKEAKLHKELGSVLTGNASMRERAELSGRNEPLSEILLNERTGTLPDGRVSARIPTIDDLPNLKYTEAVIAESMRMFPPAWAIGRSVVEDHELGGFRIPARSLVLLSPWVTHRDKRFWDRADEFVPERWETLSIKEASQRNIYLPFGGGVRRCIGESFAWTEAVLALATIARKWKLRTVPDQKIGLQPMMTLRPKFGMRMTLSEISAR